MSMRFYLLYMTTIPLLAPLAWAASYDDIQFTNFEVNVNGADKVSPQTLDIYEQARVQVVCEYQPVATGKGTALPWYSAQLYVTPLGGTSQVFMTGKGCLGGKCTIQGQTPPLAAGKVRVGCKMTALHNGMLIKDKHYLATLVPRPKAPRAATSSGAIALPPAPAMQPGVSVTVPPPPVPVRDALPPPPQPLTPSAVLQPIPVLPNLPAERQAPDPNHRAR